MKSLNFVDDKFDTNLFSYLLVYIYYCIKKKKKKFYKL